MRINLKIKFLNEPPHSADDYIFKTAEDRRRWWRTHITKTIADYTAAKLDVQLSLGEDEISLEDLRLEEIKRELIAQAHSLGWEIDVIQVEGK